MSCVLLLLTLAIAFYQLTNLSYILSCQLFKILTRNIDDILFKINQLTR